MHIIIKKTKFEIIIILLFILNINQNLYKINYIKLIQLIIIPSQVIVFNKNLEQNYITISNTFSLHSLYRTFYYDFIIDIFI